MRFLVRILSRVQDSTMTVTFVPSHAFTGWGREGLLLQGVDILQSLCPFLHGGPLSWDWETRPTRRCCLLAPKARLREVLTERRWFPRACLASQGAKPFTSIVPFTLHRDLVIQVGLSFSFQRSTYAFFPEPFANTWADIVTLDRLLSVHVVSSSWISILFTP